MNDTNHTAGTPASPPAGAFYAVYDSTGNQVQDLGWQDSDDAALAAADPPPAATVMRLDPVTGVAVSVGPPAAGGNPAYKPPAAQPGPAPLRGGTQPPRWQPPEDWAPTPGEFTGALTGAGLDAELLHHGGPGFPRVPTGYLPDGRGWILTDADGCLGDAGEPEVYGLPMPAALYLGVYESEAENAPRWPDRRGLEFNDPIGFLEGVTAGRAAAAIIEAAAGNYSALLPALVADETVPPCPAPPPVEWTLTADGRPMFGRETRDYLRAVRWAAPERIAAWRTRRCPECGKIIDGDGFIVTPDGTCAHVVLHDQIVLGCEGLCVVDPQAVGVARPHWEDWRAAPAPGPADDECAFIWADQVRWHRVLVRGAEIAAAGNYPDALGLLATYLAGLDEHEQPARVFYCNDATQLRVEFPFPPGQVRADWDRPAAQEDIDWWASLGPHVGVEAFCLLCGETFNPAGPDEMTHNRRQDEQPCGGPGIPVGAWGVRVPAAQRCLNCGALDGQPCQDWCAYRPGGRPMPAAAPAPAASRAGWHLSADHPISECSPGTCGWPAPGAARPDGLTGREGQMADALAGAITTALDAGFAPGIIAATFDGMLGNLAPGWNPGARRQPCQACGFPHDADWADCAAYASPQPRRCADDSPHDRHLTGGGWCDGVPRPFVGIPAAEDIEDGSGRRCPVCLEVIPETYDDLGERETNNYGAHYAAEHQAGGARAAAGDPCGDTTPPPAQEG